MMATGLGADSLSADDTDAWDAQELLCHPCQEEWKTREAVGICIDCQDYLCQNCFDIHTKPKPTRNHQLILKEQIERDQDSLAREDKCTIKCDRHEKNIKYRCKKHCQLGCSVCINLYHRSCDGVTYIPDMVKDLKINEEFNEAECQLKQVVERAMHMSGNANQIAENFYNDCSDAIPIIQEFRKEIDNALNMIEGALVAKLEAKKSEVLNRTIKITDIINSVQNELQQMAIKVDSLKRKEQNCDLYTLYLTSKDKLKSLTDRLEEAEMEHQVQMMGVRFVPNRDILNRLEDSFGHLLETGTGIQETESIFFKTVYFTRNDEHVKVASDTEKCFITGLALYRENTLLLVDQNNRSVKVIDVGSCNDATRLLQMASRPWDIAIIANDQVAVTLPDENEIALVKLNDIHTYVERTIYVSGECYGVDYRNDKLAVTFLHSETVQVLTLQGDVLHTLTTNQYGQFLFSKPFYVVFGRDNSALYVSNFSSNTVVCVKEEGTLMATYANSMLQGPRGLSTDKSGNVYVLGEYSNNIHKITRGCSKIKMFSTAFGFNKPHSISVIEPNNTICVGMLNNCITVYRSVPIFYMIGFGLMILFVLVTHFFKPV